MLQPPKPPVTEGSLALRRSVRLQSLKKHARAFVAYYAPSFTDFLAAVHTIPETAF